MLLSRVITGEFTRARRGLQPPPLKDPSDSGGDSCADNEEEPKIFVIFNDEQCYPGTKVPFAITSNTAVSIEMNRKHK